VSQERTLQGPSALRHHPENDVAVTFERAAHPRQAIEATTHGLAVGRISSGPTFGAGGQYRGDHRERLSADRDPDHSGLTPRAPWLALITVRAVHLPPRGGGTQRSFSALACAAAETIPSALNSARMGASPRARADARSRSWTVSNRKFVDVATVVVQLQQQYDLDLSPPPPA
jgi:hypothetical protein